MKTEQIKYRKATIDDIDILVEWRIKFLKDCFKNNNIEENRKLEFEVRGYLQGAMPDDSYVAWLAETNNNIVGIGAMIISPSLQEMNFQMVKSVIY